MRCKCGSEMGHKKVNHPDFGERHEYTCPTCRRFRACKTPDEDRVQVKVQAGAGQKVNKWY